MASHLNPMVRNLQIPSFIETFLRFGALGHALCSHAVEVHISISATFECFQILPLELFQWL